ncbi:hypothetical protein GCM10010915_27060 [Microbacterium faecale]|uniref:Uncharacterized protein n=1 Tax=Microbacterium faecale TaxID=1804630 RepID=A0A916YGK7_9MICO|nr:hypothetical protein GCM10010915_27060 [Microbacterium faecale]
MLATLPSFDSQLPTTSQNWRKKRRSTLKSRITDASDVNASHASAHRKADAYLALGTLEGPQAWDTTGFWDL